MTNVLLINDYTTRYFAVTGRTPMELLKRQDKLCELGGKSTGTLADKKGGMCPGWLFPQSKKKYVAAYVDWVNYHNNCRRVNKGIVKVATESDKSYAIQ